MDKPDDNELYPPWEAKGLPPSGKGNLDDLPKVEKSSWQPKDGEWIVLNGRLLLVQKRDDRTTILQNWNRSYQELFINIDLSGAKDCLFRPAVLGDFAVTIPNYSKVWFVEGQRVMWIYTKTPNGTTYDLTSFTKWGYHKWLTDGLIAHYDITVMPEELFKKLSEAKDVN